MTSRPSQRPRRRVRPRIVLAALLLQALLALSLGLSATVSAPASTALYRASLAALRERNQDLLREIAGADPSSPRDLAAIRERVHAARLALKRADFWLRYLEPEAYERVNGPQRVEWETEVFEKFEKPYRHEGAGLALVELALGKPPVARDSLETLARGGLGALATFESDSILRRLGDPNVFFLANRLFLLNLAAVYTTGFECPDSTRIVPELRAMLGGVREIYAAHQRDWPSAPLPPEYLAAFESAARFADRSSDAWDAFDHFAFLRDHVNPLFALNQRLIASYGVVSHSVNDWSLSAACPSIFDKRLFTAQNTLGVYSLVDDAKALADIRAVGRLLFYDPLLSGNLQRSCASCHHPAQYFTDTTVATPFQLDHVHRLARSAPSLVNVAYNPLLMLDGKHLTLQEQARAVVTNPIEMGGRPDEVLARVMTCPEYRAAFHRFQRLVPEERTITLDHVLSAITSYVGSFGGYDSPFDDAMNGRATLPEDARRGFNLFMGRAQCATCHYVPQLNGARPPYVSSEFEVIGVPEDGAAHALSADRGRYEVNPAPETLHAFRTGTVRNIQQTRPYMHNGVFRTLDQVLDFYDAGGGTGERLVVPNQTLVTDSLHLSRRDRADLKAFLASLDEAIVFGDSLAALPRSDVKAYNARKVGGDY